MSANFDIVLALSVAPRPMEYMRYNFPSFRKRMYDLKKMGFKFEEVIDTYTGALCIDMVYVPLGLEIDNEKETIKVGDYWRDHRNNLDMKRIEREGHSEFSPNYVHWIEYEGEKHYLSFGKKAPWDNTIQIRLPKLICELLNNLF